MTEPVPEPGNNQAIRDGIVTGNRSRIVRVRCVSFYADPGQLADVAHRIDNDVVPRLSGIEGFLGLVALRTDGSRAEIVTMSFWDDGLEHSETISVEFRDEIERVTGCSPSRKEFEVFKMVMPGIGKPSA